MKSFDIYFEIFGKKMKTTAIAENENEAKRKVIDKMIWHKIEPTEIKAGFNNWSELEKGFEDLMQNLGITEKNK